MNLLIHLISGDYPPPPVVEASTLFVGNMHRGVGPMAAKSGISLPKIDYCVFNMLSQNEYSRYTQAVKNFKSKINNTECSDFTFWYYNIAPLASSVPVLYKPIKSFYYDTVKHSELAKTAKSWFKKGADKVIDLFKKWCASKAHALFESITDYGFKCILSSMGFNTLYLDAIVKCVKTVQTLVMGCKTGNITEFLESIGCTIYESVRPEYLGVELSMAVASLTIDVKEPQLAQIPDTSDDIAKWNRMLNDAAAELSQSLERQQRERDEYFQRLRESL